MGLKSILPVSILCDSWEVLAGCEMCLHLQIKMLMSDMKYHEGITTQQPCRCPAAACLLSSGGDGITEPRVQAQVCLSILSYCRNTTHQSI